jgi:hypothetical protein
MQGCRVAACGRETCWPCGKGNHFYNEMWGTSHPPEAMVGLSASPPQSPPGHQTVTTALISRLICPPPLPPLLLLLLPTPQPFAPPNWGTWLATRRGADASATAGQAGSSQWPSTGCRNCGCAELAIFCRQMSIRFQFPKFNSWGYRSSSRRACACDVIPRAARRSLHGRIPFCTRRRNVATT